MTLPFANWSIPLKIFVASLIATLVSQNLLERELKSKNVPPDAFWKAGTTASLGRLIREHKDHFPKSRLRVFFGISMLLCMASLMITLFSWR